MRIAVFERRLIPSNPGARCLLRLLEGLCKEHEFTVFAVDFALPCPEHVRWVRIPLPTWPLLYSVGYHLCAPLYRWATSLRRRVRFDLVQKTGNCLIFGTISYEHSCNRTYLRKYWKQVGERGFRNAPYWLALFLRALVEPWTFRRVKHIVVVSQGLARDLVTEYPFTRKKIHIIPNPVDIRRMRPPNDFDREGNRRKLGIVRKDIALVFVALGKFEQKGLPILLEAIQRLADPRLKLLVVGGGSGLVAAYRTRAERMGLTRHISFVGMQQDSSPFLWAADAFVLPSCYEAFPLVSVEAAAAGLPLIVTALNGVEEFLRDGENGFLVERNAEGVVQGITRFLALSQDRRRAMGERARQDVEKYSLENFVAAWRELYKNLRTERKT